MKGLKCEFCNKNFTTISVLKVHTETAKYCLKLRGEPSPTQYKCEYCDDSFTQKITLKKHANLCLEHKNFLIVEKEKENEVLKTYVKSLKSCNDRKEKLTTLTETLLIEEKIKVKKLTDKRIFDLATIEKLQNEKIELSNLIHEKDQKIIGLEKKLELGKGILIGYEKVKPPNVTNNTIINQKLANLKVDNIRPLTQATIQEDIPKYTYELFLKGENGIVHYVTNMTQIKMIDGTIEQNYACTDKSRNTFHRLMESKEWTQDGGARFINEVMNSLANVAENHWKTFCDKMRVATDIFDVDYYHNKTNKLRNFMCSFSNPDSNYREQSFKKIKAKMKDISSV